MELNSNFDASYGYDLEQLLQLAAPEGPHDFAAFWERTYQQTRSVPLRLSLEPLESPEASITVYRVEFDSLDGVRVGAWVTAPANGQFERGVVVGHGYGGRDSFDVHVQGPPCVAIFPCARGFDLSARPDIPSESSGHVLHGIISRETYVHRGCAAELWSAASALIEMFPAAAQSLHYIGVSFGGGLGALALPWDARFEKAFLDVPSFGNHPLRVTLPCTGSGESVRLYYQQHPDVLEVLAYFDAATAARYIRIPTLVAAALSDPAVPPPGQFAVYNGLTARKELFVRQTGHPGNESDGPELEQISGEWFNEA